MANWKRLGRWFVGTIAVCLSVPSAQAIEVQNGVRAQSMGLAFAAVADDPSAVLHNPAGLTQIPKTEIDVGAGFQVTQLDYTDTTGVNHSYGGFAPVPTFFFSTDKLKPIVIGAGFYVPWGSKATINQDATTGFPYMHSELARYDFTVAAAYQFSKMLSVGIGFTTAYNKIKNDVPAGAGIRLSESASGFGFTGNIGVLVKPADWIKIGLNYKGPMHGSLSGDATLAGVDDSFKTHLDYPGTLSLGIAVDPIESLTVSVQYDWTHWVFLQNITRTYSTLGTTVQPINGDDASDLRIGFEYRPLAKTHFRWGYSYEQAGWPSSTILPTELEYPLHIVSVGMSQHFWKMRVDAGYELSFAVNRHETANINGFSGDYDGTRHILLVNAAFTF